MLALGKTERFILLMACLGLWLALNENLFLLVALGAGYQAFFAGDLPARPSRTAIAYFVAVLAGLGIIMRLVPTQGFGLR